MTISFIYFLFLDILAINTYDGNKRAYSIISQVGYEQLDFEFGAGTEVDWSCSLQWQNRYYVFGGENERRQVPIVNGYRLERKATLDFNFEVGGCTVLNQITIVLCFPDTYGEKDVCRQSNNPLGSFTKLPNSIFSHGMTRIASFDGKSTIYWKIITPHFRYTDRRWRF